MRRPPVAPPPGQLWCSGGHLAPVEAFAIARARKRGRQFLCQRCKSFYMLGYMLSDAGVESRRRSVQRWRERNPDRAAAHIAVAQAIARGELLPPVDRHCVLAGVAGHECRGIVSYHHRDYARPLDVEAVCRAGHDVADHHPEQLPPEWRERLTRV